MLRRRTWVGVWGAGLSDREGLAHPGRGTSAERGGSPSAGERRLGLVGS